VTPDRLDAAVEYLDRAAAFLEHHQPKRGQPVLSVGLEQGRADMVFELR
jgi:hypothetical protein